VSILEWRSAAAGLLAGLGLAAVDAGLVAGPPRPVVMVALTLAAGVGLGAAWNWRGWPGAVVAGGMVPAVHLVKLQLGLPDTIQPRTLDAVAMMALFGLAVSAAGFCGGVMVRQAASSPGA